MSDLWLPRTQVSPYPQLLVATIGGTIAGVWNQAKDTATPSANIRMIPEFLASVGIPYEIEHASITNADSRDLTTEDRERFLAAIDESTADKVLGTHGTFHAADTAAFVELRRGQSFNKWINVTCAYTPMEGFLFSDGPFNLGFAIANFETREPGTRVCMSGQAFRPGEVTKMLSVPKFESLHDTGVNPFAGGRALVVLAGGTIDEEFDGKTERIKPRRRSAVPGYLRLARLNWQISCAALALKDSRHVTDADRESIAKRIEATDEKFVVVTHGLFRMAELQEYLAHRLADTDKEIILVGSERPLGTENSDAGFNLGYAFGRKGSLGPGVHICHRGRVMSADQLRGYLAAERFEVDFVPPIDNGIDVNSYGRHAAL